MPPSLLLLLLLQPIDESPAENTPNDRNMSGTATFFSIWFSLKFEIRNRCKAAAT